MTEKVNYYKTASFVFEQDEIVSIGTVNEEGIVTESFTFSLDNVDKENDYNIKNGWVRFVKFGKSYFRKLDAKFEKWLKEEGFVNNPKMFNPIADISEFLEV